MSHEVVRPGRLRCYCCAVIEGEYAELFVGEVARYLSKRLGWTSTLMVYSTPGLIGELLLAGREAATKVLSSASFDEIKQQVYEQVLLDPGLGDMRVRGPLRQQLPRDASEFSADAHKHKGIRSIL